MAEKLEGYVMKKKGIGFRTIFLIFIGVSFLIGIISSFSGSNSQSIPQKNISQTKKEMKDSTSIKECIDRLKNTEKLMMNVKYEYMEWYIDPAVWTGFTLQQKENLINSLSCCRKIVYGYSLVEIKNGYTGRKLATIGIAGPKIYN